MQSTLMWGQKITRHESERLRVGYTPSIRALALNIATCKYAKPLAIALWQSLCAADYTATPSRCIQQSIQYPLADAPSGLVTIHGQENPSWPYAPATFDILPPPP